MPVNCREIGGKWRIVEASSGRIAKTENDVPRDGGGHDSEDACMAQARALNQAYAEKKEGGGE